MCCKNLINWKLEDNNKIGSNSQNKLIKKIKIK